MLLSFMISKTRLFIFACLLLILTVGLSNAQSYTVRPTGSNHDQDVINEALKDAAKNGGGTVYLENSGTNYVFITNGPIEIPSGNIFLTGDSDIIVRVYFGSDAVQWFTGTNSIITATGQIDNLEICGFQIDGSCDKLPFDFHHSRSDTAHDCERAIYVQGSSGRFNNNIKVHDMQIYNCFSDGIHIRFANNVHCYSNFISNTQHEGLFWTSIVNGLMESNQVAGITSDCARLDNCISCIVQNNYFFSYSGNKNSQAPKGHQNGIQIADAGASHGYDASNKPTHTKDVEVRWNTFANTGEKAVWLDSTGKGYDNVYIHDNKFVNVNSFTNDGTSVKLNMEVTNNPEYHDYSGEIDPTKATSEGVFNSIFDFLDMKVYTQVGQNDTVVLPVGMKESSSKALCTIEYQTIGNNTTTFVRIDKKYLEGVSEVRYEVNGQVETHTLMLGERTSEGVVFTKASVWSNNLQHSKESLKLNGKIDADSIKVKCITPKGSFVPIFEITEANFNPVRIHPGIFLLLGIVIFGIIELCFIFRHIA